MTGISAILMAAGFSGRMGRDKLMLPYRGKTLLRHAVDLLESLPVFEKILVTTDERLSGLELPKNITAVINMNPGLGQSESLKLGVSAATGVAYLFLAADQPRLTAGHLIFLLEAAEKFPGKIIYPTIRGSPCMPALFPAAFRAELLALSGDEGGRSVRGRHPGDCLAIEAEFPGAFADIDTERDYSRFVSDII